MQVPHVCVARVIRIFKERDLTMSRSSKVRPPIILTVVTVLVVGVGSFAYEQYRGPFEGKMAVRQADGTDSGAVAGTFFTRNDMPSLARLVGGGVIMLAWGSYLLRKRSESSPSSEPTQG
jgi:hypothetical protein